MESVRLLLYRLSLGKCSPKERAALEEWAGNDAERRALIERLSDPDYVARQILRRSLVAVERPKNDMKMRISAIRHATWRKYAAAAAIIIVLLSAGFFLFSNKTVSSPDQFMALRELVDSIDTNNEQQEIRPGSTKARLITNTGAIYRLTADDTLNIKKEPDIPSSFSSQSSHDLCIDVPRGGEFKITLEDSTEVWLNSESMLIYPEAFQSSERRVKLSGEAYFSVKKDTNRPFFVETDKQVVKVYGTLFNIRAYSDDPYIYTTLEKGSISISRIENPSGEVLISPGHQALFNRKDMKVDMRVVDPKAITGWRHGRFVFEEQPLANIMRDLCRWYDFKYEFTDEGLKDTVFMGSIPRYSDFKTVMAILEKCGGLRFSVNGNKVTISPQ
ncbi:MAG: DUF4974 domain-containing protein [Duncaniella sp.]|nr:DUF4974 domain-containing protein [Duncaniella sp.]